MKKNLQKKRGFTLVESLVAISIIVVAIISTTDIVRIGIFSHTFSKDQVIAFHLAQEAFEEIRNIRDKNALENVDWLTNIAYNSSDPCYFGNTCIVDPINTTVPDRCDSGPGNCPFIRQEESTGFFGYDASWTPTIYQREISLTQVNDDEVAITVTVNWLQGTSSRTFEARENLLNWP